jgi:hypothetical protein
MVKFLYLILATLALAFLGCSGGGGKHVAGPKGDSGPAISLTAIGTPNGLSKVMVVSEVVTCPGYVNSCLGLLYTGQSYEYLLENTSEDPLDSLTFTTSDSTAWSTNPTYIPVLQIPGAGGFQPVLRVNVAHGSSTTMLGAFPLLWDGLDTGKAMVLDTITLGYVQAGERKSQQFIIGVLVKTARFQYTSDKEDTLVVVGNCPIVGVGKNTTHPDSVYYPGDRLPKDSTEWRFKSPCANKYNDNGQYGNPDAFGLGFPITDLDL